MRGKMRRAALLLAAAVFVTGSVLAIHQVMDYRAAQMSYAEAQAAVEMPQERVTELPDPEVPLEEVPQSEEDRLRALDLDPLWDANEDVLGWISVPGTGISYPLLQGEDNNEYLRRSWDRSRNSAGSIFLEERNSADLGDFNTIIYGHHMRNGTMFAPLVDYQRQSFYEEHSEIYIVDQRGIRKYKVFAAYEVSTTGDTYRVDFSEEGTKQAFLEFCMGQSVLETGTVPTVEDKVLTLSTCTGDGYDTRWVVQAVLTDVFTD